MRFDELHNIEIGGITGGLHRKVGCVVGAFGGDEGGQIGPGEADGLSQGRRQVDFGGLIDQKPRFPAPDFVPGPGLCWVTGEPPG